MRQIQAEVAAEPFMVGGLRLHITADTGEELSVELSPAKASVLAAAITAATTVPAAPVAEPAPPVAEPLSDPEQPAPA